MNKYGALCDAINEQDETAFLSIYNTSCASFVSETGATLLHQLLRVANGKMDNAIRAVIELTNINAKDSKGMTPLMVAAMVGREDWCNQLLARGALITEKANDGNTALTIALQNGHAGVCDVLVLHDHQHAEETLCTVVKKGAEQHVEQLLDAGVSPDTTVVNRRNGRLLIHEAVHRPSILRILFRYGVDVNAKDSEGRTALSLAAAAGDVVTCKLLIEAGATWQLKDIHGCSPMYHACSHEKEGVIEFLLALGDNASTMDNRQRTCLFYHAERGNVRGCALMLRLQVDIHHQDTSKWTAMHMAASYGHRDVCRLLCDELNTWRRSTTNDKVLCRLQPRGSTFAWVGVETELLFRIYGELVKDGVGSIQTKYGTLMIRDYAMNSLLHITSIHCGDQQCSYLIRSLHTIGGIPIHVQNCYGKTALDVARDQKRSIAVAVLESLDENSCIADGQKGNETRGGFIHVSSNAIKSTPVTSREYIFSECSRSRLAQLSRGIENGVYSCTDDIVAQIDVEQGDTVLHYFLQDFCERDEFPSASAQRHILTSENWLGQDSDRITVLVNKKNWEGKTALHLAAELGALGFCQVLFSKGASMSTECGSPDCRLLNHSGIITTQHWKALNFAALGRVKSNRNSFLNLDAAEVYDQREQLIQILLRHTESLPTHEATLNVCRDQIGLNFARFLPDFVRLEDEYRNKEAYEQARELFREYLSMQEIGINESTHMDPSGVHLYKIFLDTMYIGIHVLDKFSVNQLVIESTGDTLLHLVAAHGHKTAIPLLRRLLGHDGMDVNHINKQWKTPLHISCETQNVEICMFLLSSGADVSSCCQNVHVGSTTAWFTPLYSALWSQTPCLEIIEILLKSPRSVVEPRNPKLFGRSDTYATRHRKTVVVTWNSVILRRLAEVHPSALPLFLDHFSFKVNHLNGGVLYQFTEVRSTCEELEVVLRPTMTDSSKYSPSPCVTHPVVRNAIHLKWKLFGAACHRRQLALYTLMLVFFYLTNVVLPGLKRTSDGSQLNWIHASTANQVICIIKIASWILAAYHLLYVELWLEWRADRGRYWRSLWNLLDICTYILMILTIPLNFLHGDWSTFHECLLSLLSVMLCTNLMQALLVSAYFSVLIFTFARMCRVVGQFFFHYVLLVFGFAGGLHVLYHDNDGPHSDFVSSMRVVFLATFGELDYHRNFYSSKNDTARNMFAFVLLVLYVIVVMIVALNLMTALMTSEYENVRSRAEERSLLELAGALHRYEQWLGNDLIKGLYDSVRGQSLLQDCECRIPISSQYHHFNNITTNCVSSYSHNGTSEGEKVSQNAIQDTRIIECMTEVVVAEMNRRLAEESSSMRAEVVAKLQEITELLTQALGNRGNSNRNLKVDSI